MSNHFTITGALGSDPELRFTPQGAAVCNGSIADTPRRKNPQTGAWEDSGETLWIRFTIWNAAAEALAETARKGDRVMATGRLKQRSWEDRATGQKRVAVELDAQAVAILPKTPQGTRGGGQSTVDPWTGVDGGTGWGPVPDGPAPF